MLEVFTKVDKTHSDSMDIHQYKKAMTILKEDVAMKALDKMHLTTFTLYMVLATVIIFLLVLLMFIFIGIIAFSPVNSFSGVVNSIMPIAAGAGANSKGHTSKQLEKVMEKLEGSVKQVIKNLKF